MKFTPTEQDLLQLEQMGLTADAVQHQIDNFKQGFPKSHLDAAATPDNNGIIRLGDGTGSYIVEYYPVALQLKDVLIVLATITIIGGIAAFSTVKVSMRKQL